MHLNIIIAACMLVVTTVIHAGGMVLVRQVFDWKKDRSIKRRINVELV